VRACGDVTCSQINVSSVEELESFIEQIMAVPLLLRVFAHFFHNDYFGAALPERRFEGRQYAQHTPGRFTQRHLMYVSFVAM